ncbi:thioredoxin [Pseudoalteromonas phage J2-1_QLiu-2017]|nr:thioredoxin [Pseudoalteromonas phage J2-1_QLiu-2017]
MQLINVGNHFSNAQMDYIIEQITSIGYQNVVQVSLHGSHLYGLNRDGSDLDVKLLYLPSLEDLLRGNVKSKNVSNKDLNIDVDLIPMNEYVRILLRQDINAMDTYFCGEDNLLYRADFIDDLTPIFQDPSWFLCRQMKGIVGYIKTQTHKYSHKIDRLAAMKALREAIDPFDWAAPINTDMVLPVVQGVAKEHPKYIKMIYVKGGQGQDMIEVCGKKYTLTWSLDMLVSALDKEITRYGERTEKGLLDGIDGKSMSHALRSLYQAKELLETGRFTFPLKQREEIMEVKLGNRTTEEMLVVISDLYDEVMEMLENSDLPEEPRYDIPYGELEYVYEMMMGGAY